jgi:hypothetical protein
MQTGIRVGLKTYGYDEKKPTEGPQRSFSAAPPFSAQRG